MPPEARLVAPRRGGRRALAAVAGQSVVPAGNLTANPSFERDTAGWDMYRSILRTEGAADAPDGQSVVRVLARHSEGEYSIDDFPDTMESSVAGRRYRAAAWVKGTRSTTGRSSASEFASGPPKGSS